MHTNHFRVMVTLAALVAATVVFGQVGKVGPRFQVNDVIEGNQRLPDVAVEPSGEFVAVWQSDGADGDGIGVVGRRFDSDGIPLGGEFLINTTSNGDQTVPRVAGDGTGRFVVVWRSTIVWPWPPVYRVVARLFDGNGDPSGNEFFVDADQADRQIRPDVTMDDDGDPTLTRKLSRIMDSRSRHVDGVGVVREAYEHWMIQVLLNSSYREDA